MIDRFSTARALKSMALAALIAAALLLPPRPSHTAFLVKATWGGGGADANWSSDANWAPALAPPEDARLIFPAAAARLANVNDLPVGRSFDGIEFTGDGGGYSLSGNSFVLEKDIEGNALIASNTSGTNTINNDVRLAESQSFTSDVAGTSLIFAGELDLAGYTLTVDGEGDVEMSGSLAGADSGILKEGGGVLTLSIGSSFSGTAVVNEGDFVLEEAVMSGVDVTVAGGALKGSGSLGALTAEGGRIAPGLSPGSISLGGDLSLGSDSTLEVEIDGTAAGTEYDQLDVTGGVNVDGAALDAAFGFTPQAGDEFVIISNDGDEAVAGGFAGLTQGTPVDAGGVPVVVDYSGGDGNDVSLAVVTLSVDDIEVTESDPSVTQDTAFTVTLSASTTNTVSVDYATSDGTATSPPDYEATSGTLEFGALETSKEVTVGVSGDWAPEDETFTLNLSDPTNALIGKAEGICTIHGAAGGGGCGCIMGAGRIGAARMALELGMAFVLIFPLFIARRARSRSRVE